jgi:hypothetical protein
MSRKWIRIAACLLAFAPAAGRAAECALGDIARRAQLAAAAATSAGQEQSRKLSAEAQRGAPAPEAMLNVAPEAQLSERGKARLADIKLQMTYWRLHQHYIAEARAIESEIALAAEAARLLQSGTPVKESDQKHVDVVHYLRQHFPDPATNLATMDAAPTCDLPHALHALEHAAADALNAIPIREQSARIQTLARKYALDMSKSAWGNSQAWLDAIPSAEERRKAKEDLTSILRARLAVALINDLQNLRKVYDFSLKKLAVFENELARLVRERAVERVGEAWSGYIAAAPPEEKKLNALLDFMQSGNKDANAANARAP